MPDAEPTIRSSYAKWLFAGDMQTDEQYSKTRRMNDQKPRETMESSLITKRAFLKIILWREEQATADFTWL